MRQNQQQEMLRSMRPDMNPQQQAFMLRNMQNNMAMGGMKGGALARTAMANNQHK